mmetsp:Transcript_61331/g.115643  ORF Transcript_61331/g.115643 Transcript_61331/m.115643 type:complete len:704 (+) Transcript_61331:52-2163(+)
MFCSRRKPLAVNHRLGVQRRDLAQGEIGGPLYLAGFEEQGPRAVPLDGSSTAWQCIQRSSERFAERNAAGTRRILKVHEFEENGKKLEKLELENSYTWLTYQELALRVTRFASGLLALTEVPEQARMVIYAETQQDWMVAALAAFTVAIQVVTVYATLGEEGALFGLQQTRATVVVADAKLLKILVKIAPSCTFLKHAITITPCEAKAGEQLKAAGITVHSLDEVLAKGLEVPCPQRPPASQDVAVVMYTSGTTGMPKGVLISHGNLVAAVAGFQEAAGRAGVDQDVVYLAYLPLAHVMELVAELAIMSLGGSLGYGSPQTLVESGLKLKRPESEGDALVLKPTFLVFAPAVLDRVYKAVTKKVEAGTAFKKFLFSAALAAGQRNYDAGGIGAGPLRNFVFGAIQRMLGGNVKHAVTGSAPLSAEIQQFMQTVLNCPVRQGYGLTENCATATLGNMADNSVQDVGAPQACAVIRLADWVEGSYLNSDVKRPDVGMPRGEVLVGGPNVALGYLVDEENPDPEVVKKNEEEFVVIDNIRYFRTGDIGQITPQGTLQIIDRKKDLWKGPQGEYVSLSKVEAALKLSSFVEISMVYGKTGGQYPVALICPSESRLQQVAEELGVEKTFPAALCTNAMIVTRVLDDLKEVCRSSKLLDFEIPKKIALVPGSEGQPAWTPENDMLTAAMKLKRPVIAKAFSAEIAGLYT